LAPVLDAPEGLGQKISWRKVTISCFAASMATTNDDNIIVCGVKSFRGVFDKEISDRVKIERFGG